MKKCPTCIEYVNNDAALLCQFCGTPLLDTIVSPDAFEQTIKPERSNEEDIADPALEKSVTFSTATGPLPISPVLGKEVSFIAEEPESFRESNNARNNVHKLIVFWINLIITNFVIFAVANIFGGFILGVVSLLLIFPLSIAISKFPGHSAIQGALIGVFIFAIIEGGIAYLIYGSYGVGFGILYGALYGASLPSYFSVENKCTNLFGGALSILFLIGSIVVLAFIQYSVGGYISIIKSVIGEALIGGIITIILGLPMIPLLPHYIRRIESFLEEFVNLARYE